LIQVPFRIWRNFSEENKSETIMFIWARPPLFLLGPTHARPRAARASPLPPAPTAIGARPSAASARPCPKQRRAVRARRARVAVGRDAVGAPPTGRGQAPRRPRAAWHPTARPPHSSPFFSPRLEKLPSALLLFSARATVSPRFSTPVSYPVLRRACSAGSTHRHLSPSPEFGPPLPLTASRVGKPCLVEFLKFEPASPSLFPLEVPGAPTALRSTTAPTLFFPPCHRAAHSVSVRPRLAWAGWAIVVVAAGPGADLAQ
jgi:hypothetical protein